MAKRKQLFHPDDIKSKIQASQLINRLQNHALCDYSSEDCDAKPMLDSQVRAAFGLLDKAVPSLKAIEHTGEIDHSVTVTKIQREIVRPKD